MRISGIAVAAVLMASSVLAEDAAAPVNVRKASDGRVWQVALQPAEPIVWRWPDWATAAQLTATSYVGKVVTSLTVTRGEGEAFGSWTFPPAVNDFDESIHDVTLELKKGEKVYEGNMMKLEENENSTKVRLLKVKEMVLQDAHDFK